MTWEPKASSRLAYLMFLFLAVASAGFAQPRWVKHAVEIENATQVHADAPYVILHNSAELEVSERGRAKARVRRAVKVLRSSSMDAAVLRESVNDWCSVRNVKGWNLRYGRVVSTLGKADVVEISLQQEPGLYDEERTLLAAVPDASVGDVVAFEYEIEEKNPWAGLYEVFTFQDSAPVLYARLQVTIPKGWRLHMVERWLDSVQFEHKVNSYTWETGHLPYRPEEPYMPPAELMRRRVHISCYDPTDTTGNQFADWPSASRWAWELHDEPASPGIGVDAVVRELVSGLSSPGEKLRAIGHYVRDAIRPVSIEIGPGRYQPRPAELTLVNRYGDCKDKVALMRAMLRAVQIPSLSVLALIDGQVEETIPSPLQFNHCLVAVPLECLPSLEPLPRAVADGWLYFDPSDPSTALGNLPLSLYNSQVLRASDTEAGLARLPLLFPEHLRRNYTIDATINPDNSVAARVTIVDYGDMGIRSSYEQLVAGADDLVAQYQQMFAPMMKNAVVSDLLANNEGDSAWVRFVLHGEQFVTETGDVRLLKADLVHEDQAADLGCGDRIFPIWFGPPAQVTTDITWRLPDGWQLAAEPEAIVDTCRIARISSYMENVGGLFRIRTHVEYDGETLPAADCERARGFVRSRNAVRAMRVVLEPERVEQ